MKYLPVDFEFFQHGVKQGGGKGRGGGLLCFRVLFKTYIFAIIKFSCIIYIFVKIKFFCNAYQLTLNLFSMTLNLGGRAFMVAFIP